MKMPSNMAHDFSRVPAALLQRSQFVSPYKYTTAFNSGYIIPFMVDEVLPGDTFNDQFQIFARLQSLIKPLMDNLWVDTHYFFVPNRLVWNNWEKFNGAQDNPDDPTDFLVPTCTSPSGFYTVGSLQDYMGLPVVSASNPNTTGKTFTHDNLLLRAYNLIWNDYYRDENLQDSVVVDKDDGPDDPADYVLLKRGKRHDYFTSALPWPQKGDPVLIPLTGNAPVLGLAFSPGATMGSTTDWNDYNTLASGVQVSYANSIQSSSVGAVAFQANGATGGATGPNVYADLSSVSAVTINEFRQAFQVQMLLEKDARGGTRYVEILRSHFGVISPDFRLQRPEYLGGSTTPLSVIPVAQTGSTDATTPQANLSAFAVVSNHRDGYVKSFVEHGMILCMLSVRADLTYQQGMHRMWSRQTRYDFYWPAFANLGEQSILNKEIYTQGTADDDLVFGYQEAWAEYRYKPSLITGEMRSQVASSLDIWHLAQEFAGLPLLNSTFITENPPVDRVVAVDTEPQFFLDVFGHLKRSREMPVFSVPGLITRL